MKFHQEKIFSLSQVILRRSFHLTRQLMGIQGLSRLIGDNAPGAMKENDIKNYFGRKVAM
jgi:hypothetical protein